MKNKPKQTRAAAGGPGGLTAAKEIFGTAWRALITLAMVGVITGCIVACVMTVYILKYIGAENDIDLKTVQLGYTSVIYAYNSETEAFEELQLLYYGGENRIWVDYENINAYTRDAIVAVEDQRFWKHQGVDWKRTAAAGLNLFVPLQGTTAGGGSTITQQLIKNVTEDNEYRIERKVREIFRALNLSKKYSREQILESYLNVVPFGNGTNGIQSAANTYFDKDAKDLSLAESAAIVGITQYPGYYDPFVNPDNNKDRQEHILREMLKQGYITQSEHDAAVKEDLDWKGEQHFEALSTTQSYFVDFVIDQVIADLMAEKGYTYSRASELLFKGGYRIYSTVDLNIQAHLEEFYSTTDNFPALKNADYPQSASVVTDPHGKILAMVGGIGEKEGARILNRASQSKRHPGSSIKPLAAYALAFEYDRITWSTIFEDSAITLEDGSLWPTNYYGGYDGNMTVDLAIQRSTNTIPAKLVQAITPRKIFDFLTTDLHFHSLVEREVVGNKVYSDVTLSAMALGGMTHGVTPLEMAGGYQIYANGGQFTQPYAYTEVLDSQGRTILEKDTAARQVINKDTAVVVNKLLQRVTGGPRGTGTAANLGIMPTAGKTGTSSNNIDHWFIGVTPYYVCQVWMGYDEQTYVDQYGNLQANSIGYYSYPPPIVFKNIMLPLHENLEFKNFVDSEGVVSMEYCTISGNIAGASCPRAPGWYKKSNIPNTCTGHVVKSETSESSRPDNQVSSAPDDNGPSIIFHD